MFGLGKKKQLLHADDQAKIVACIQAAESRTSGEIRVFIEAHCSYVDPLDRAKEVFANLEMHKTQERNAIIIYLALNDHQFALFGDVVIYEKAGGAAFWQNAAHHMRAELAEGRIMEGICTCINELSEPLAQHFPPNSAINKNELPDEIVFGK